MGHGFDLDDLASVELDYSAGDYLPPLVPEMSGTHLIANNSNTSGLPIRGCGLLERILGINLVLETHEGTALVGEAVLARKSKIPIVEHFGLIVVARTHGFQLTNGHRVSS